MPTPGRDRDSRISRTSLSAYSVSPTKTGAGRRTLSQPRLANAFSLMSTTDIPVTSASVKALLTSGRPNSVCAAKA